MSCILMSRELNVYHEANGLMSRTVYANDSGLIKIDFFSMYDVFF